MLETCSQHFLFWLSLFWALVANQVFVLIHSDKLDCTFSGLWPVVWWLYSVPPWEQPNVPISKFLGGTPDWATSCHLQPLAAERWRGCETGYCVSPGKRKEQGGGGQRGVGMIHSLYQTSQGSDLAAFWMCQLRRKQVWRESRNHQLRIHPTTCLWDMATRVLQRTSDSTCPDELTNNPLTHTHTHTHTHTRKKYKLTHMSHIAYLSAFLSKCSYQISVSSAFPPLLSLPTTQPPTLIYSGNSLISVTQMLSDTYIFP